MDTQAFEEDTLERDWKPTVYIAGQLVAWNWRTQILEEIRLNNSKQVAGTDPGNPGIYPEDIAWHMIWHLEKDKLLQHNENNTNFAWKENH